MKLAKTKRFRLKDETVVFTALLEGFEKQPHKIAICARRDLLFLNLLMEKLDTLPSHVRLRLPNYWELQKRVIEMLEELNHVPDEARKHHHQPQHPDVLSRRRKHK